MISQGPPAPTGEGFLQGWGVCPPYFYSNESLEKTSSLATGIRLCWSQLCELRHVT